MDDLLEFLIELFLDAFLWVMEKIRGKTKGKSGASYRIAVTLCLLVMAAVMVFFAICACLAWQAGDIRQLWLYGGVLAVAAALLAFVGLRRFFRWRKLRRERMYDPRYQK